MAGKKPEKIILNGEPLKLCLLKVESKSVRGVPMNLTLVEDEQVIQIEEGMEFITAYISEKMLKGTI